MAHQCHGACMRSSISQRASRVLGNAVCLARGQSLPQQHQNRSCPWLQVPKTQGKRRRGIGYYLLFGFRPGRPAAAAATTTATATTAYYWCWCWCGPCLQLRSSVSSPIPVAFLPQATDRCGSSRRIDRQGGIIIRDGLRRCGERNLPCLPACGRNTASGS